MAVPHARESCVRADDLGGGAEGLHGGQAFSATWTVVADAPAAA